MWLLEECNGLDYDIKVYKRTAEKLAPPELKEVHPLGKSPVISVESAATTKPIILAESGAMTEYMSEHFAPNLIPTRYQAGKEGQVGGETEEWLRYRFFMHYAEGSLMTLLLLNLFVDGECCCALTLTCFVDGVLTLNGRNQKRTAALLHQAHHPRHRRQGGDIILERQLQIALDLFERSGCQLTWGRLIPVW